MANGAWYVHIVAVESNGEKSTERVFGPYIIGDTQPVIDLVGINGIVDGEEIEYMFSDENDPNNPNVLIPTVHSSFKDYNMRLTSISNANNGKITSVKIVRINGVDVVGPGTYDFYNTPDTDIWEYDGLTFDTSLRYNRLLIESIDDQGFIAWREALIEYIPPAHVDVRVTADVSSAFTDSQITLDQGGTLEENDDLVKFTTTVFSPGAKGLSASYYSDDHWGVLNKNFLEEEFNHGTVLGYTQTYLKSGGRTRSSTNPYSARTTMTNLAGVPIDATYSVKWEGRIRAPESGIYKFDLELGASDYVEVKIDQNDVYTFENNKLSETTIYDTTLHGIGNDDGLGDPEPLHLDQGVWYGISVKYIGRHDLTGSPVDDAIRISWKHIRDGADFYTDPVPITSENLALNAGNITSIIDNYDVSVTLPEGFESVDFDVSPPIISYYDTDGVLYQGNEQTPIYLKPASVSPEQITESGQIQTIIWNFTTPDMLSTRLNDGDIPIRFRTVLPVGNSLQITHYARAIKSRLIGPEDEI